MKNNSYTEMKRDLKKNNVFIVSNNNLLPHYYQVGIVL